MSDMNLVIKVALYIIGTSAVLFYLSLGVFMYRRHKQPDEPRTQYNNVNVDRNENDPNRIVVIQHPSGAVSYDNWCNLSDYGPKPKWRELARYKGVDTRGVDNYD